MQLLKTLFPISFGTKDLANLIIKLIIFAVVSAVSGFVVFLLIKIPVINIIAGLLGGLIEMYLFFATVILLLAYFNILK